MWAIFKREFKSFFITPIGYIFLALNLIVSGYFFVASTLFIISDYGIYQYSDMSSYFGSIGIILLFFVPILTMKLISEEKRNKTDQLLFTSPVTPIKIVLGKYFAVCAVFLVSQIISLTYLVILMIYGEPNIINCLSMYLGFTIMGFAFISVGMFSSSLTENQIISAVIGFCLLLCFWLVPAIASMMSNDVMVNILSWLSITNRYEPFTGNLLSLSAIIYFITFAMLFLAFTVFRLSRINLRKITNFMLAIAIVIGLNLGVELLSSKTNLEYDMSNSGIYTLTNETKKVLAELKNDVTIYFFTSSGTRDGGIDFNKLFDKYKKQSNKIKVEIIDPEKNPQYATQFNKGAKIENFSIGIVYGDKSKLLSYGENYLEQSNQTEAIVTNAIVNLTTGVEPKIAYLGGHGTELDESSFTDIATYAQVKIDSINPLKQDISKSYDTFIICAPKVDFNKKEIARIKKYVKNGGNLQVYYDIDTKLPNFNKYLKDYWAVKIDSNIVLESDASRYLKLETIIVPDFGENEITSTLTTPMYIPNTRTITLGEKADIEPIELLTSSETSYAKSNLNAKTLAQEKGDIDGPLGLAYLLESSKSSLFVAGSSSMAEQYADYNYNFIVNTINYQSGSKDMQVRPKPMDEGTLTMTGSQVLWTSVIILLLLPLALIIASIIIYRKRRKM